MKNTWMALPALLLVALAACDGGSTSETTADTLATADSASAGVTLTQADDIPELQEAMLELNEPAESEVPTGDVAFNFEVKNFELKQQSPEAADLGLANSAEGQHIHFILNNGPYKALYDPAHVENMTEGYHVVLAFLSRSYHCSVKNPAAFVVRDFVVGDAGDVERADLTAPHMFYSRPKGEYTGEGAQKVLLDFYLVNADLSADGHKIRVSANGEELETLTEWSPYYLEGLPMGENTVKLEFIDADGNLVDSPFNPVERTFTLKGAAM
ncbi:MAG: phosphopeptide-binding protein [Catalinimonas sp.]